MAVATQTKGRNLAPYEKLRPGSKVGGVQVLVTPELTRLAGGIQVDVRRWVTKGFRVDFIDPTCQI